MEWFKQFTADGSNPLLGILDDAAFRVWFRLLCLAMKTRGTIPAKPTRLLAIEAAAGDEALLVATVGQLADLGIIETQEGGAIAFVDGPQRQPRKPSDEPEAQRERQAARREREAMAREGVTPLSRHVTRDENLSRPRRKEGEIEGRMEGSTHAGSPARATPTPSTSSLRSTGELAPSCGRPGEGGGPGEDGAGAHDGCAAAVEVGGWLFTPEDYERLAAATADVETPPLEMPLAVRGRLLKRAQLPVGNPQRLPDTVLALWDAKPGADVAAWCEAGIVLAKRKKGSDRSGLLDMAAGIIGQAIQHREDLPATATRRSSIGVSGVSPAASPALPPADHLAAFAAEEKVAKQLATPEGARRGRLELVRHAVAHYGPGSEKALAAMTRHGVTNAELAAYQHEIQGQAGTAAGGAS